MREIVYWRREMNEDMGKGIYICHRVVERNLFSEFYKTNMCGLILLLYYYCSI